MGYLRQMKVMLSFVLLLFVLTEVHAWQMDAVDGRNSLAQRLVAQPGNEDYSQRVVELVNDERWNNGQLPPLKKNWRLDSSSGTHSRDMAGRDFFAHCDPDTQTLPWDRMTAAGYTWNAAAENIAAGQSTPETVMAAWMASSGHRASILSAGYREIGVGYSYQQTDSGNVRTDSNGDCVPDGNTAGPFRHYWTQNFGRYNSAYPLVIAREDDEISTATVDLYVYGEGIATEMRFQNENAAWSPWEAFAADKTWVLSAGAGMKTVTAQIRNGSVVHTATDSVLLVQGCSVLAQDHYLHVPAQTANVSQAFSACNTLYAGAGGYQQQSGDLVLQAPRVVLQPGFSVAANAGLSVLSNVP